MFKDIGYVIMVKSQSEYGHTFELPIVGFKNYNSAESYLDRLTEKNKINGCGHFRAWIETIFYDEKP